MSEMVNMSRDEVIEALRGIRRINDADNQALQRAIAEIAGNPSEPNASMQTLSGMPQAQLQEVLIAVTADSLILNDRSVPLVRRETVNEAFDKWSKPYQARLSGDDRAQFEAILETLRSYLTNVIEQSNADVESAYDRKWREITAYRDLVAERGTIDATDKELRDTFIRRSTTPEEWRAESDEAVRIMIEQNVAMVRTLFEQLFEQAKKAVASEYPDMIIDDEIDDEFNDEIKSMERELQEQLAPVLKAMTDAVRAYCDCRYLELWAEPSSAQD